MNSYCEVIRGDPYSMRLGKGGIGSYSRAHMGCIGCKEVEYWCIGDVQEEYVGVHSREYIGGVFRGV